MPNDEDPNQPDPWAASIRSGTAPKPKAKAQADSWKSFKPGEAELPEDLSRKPKSGGGRSGRGSKAKAIPSGPYLARRRVIPRRIMGQVLEWKGKYGWIQPHTPVQHPKANKHNGKIFVSTTDLKNGCRSLDPGSLCEFFVFEDDAGLGAEECTAVEECSLQGGRAGAAAIAQSGGSMSSSYRGAEDRSSARGKGGGKSSKGKGGAAKGSGRGMDAFGGFDRSQANASQSLIGHPSDGISLGRGSGGTRGRGRGQSGKQNYASAPGGCSDIGFGKGSFASSAPPQPSAGGYDPFASTRAPPPYPDIYSASALSMSLGRPNPEMPHNLHEPNGLMTQLPPGPSFADPSASVGPGFPATSYASSETDIWGCGGLGLQGFSGFGDFSSQEPSQSTRFGPMI